MLRERQGKVSKAHSSYVGVLMLPSWRPSRRREDETEDRGMTRSESDEGMKVMVNKSTKWLDSIRVNTKRDACSGAEEEWRKEVSKLMELSKEDRRRSNKKAKSKRQETVKLEELMRPIALKSSLLKNSRLNRTLPLPPIQGRARPLCNFIVCF